MGWGFPIGGMVYLRTLNFLQSGGIAHCTKGVGWAKQELNTLKGGARGSDS